MFKWQVDVHKSEKTDNMYTYRPSGENRSAGERLVNLCDYVGRTPLHYACYDNNKELLQQLLDAGAVPTAR